MVTAGGKLSWANLYVQPITWGKFLNTVISLSSKIAEIRPLAD